METPTSDDKDFPLVPSASNLVPQQQKPVSKRRNKKQSVLTRIERYNLSELCFRLYWNMSRDVEDIVIVLNNALQRKRDALLKEGMIDKSFDFSTITSVDVKTFLRKFHYKLENTLEGKERRMIDHAMDVVRTLQTLLNNASETMEIWYNKLMDAVGRDDSKLMTQAQRMLTVERQQISQIVDKLANLTGKVKTYISIDSLHSQVRSIAAIIEENDMISDDARLSILNEVMHSLEIEVSQMLED